MAGLVELRRVKVKPNRIVFSVHAHMKFDRKTREPMGEKEEIGVVEISHLKPSNLEDYLKGHPERDKFTGKNFFEVEFQPFSRIQGVDSPSWDGYPTDMPPTGLGHKVLEALEKKVFDEHPGVEGLIIFTANPAMSRIARKAKYTRLYSNQMKAFEPTGKLKTCDVWAKRRVKPI
jgi:hypothetical protein